MQVQLLLLFKLCIFLSMDFLENSLKCNLHTTKFILMKMYFGEFFVRGYFGTHFDFLKYCIDILILMTEFFGTF